MAIIASLKTAAPHISIPQGAARIFAFRAPLRRDHGLPPSLGRAGSLEVRLAATEKDVRKAQKLRYRVFYEEGGARADRATQLIGRDICPFDALADHLLVIDHAAVSRFGRVKPKIVGVYRLLRQSVAERFGGFYSAGEFDLAPLLERQKGKRFLELGRSCVLPDYRSKKVIDLLWRGLWAYVQHHRIDALIGCASFPSANPLDHAEDLSFLAATARASEDWSASARSELYVRMDLRDPAALDMRRALANLPPLIKGYLRVGAKFGDGAVVDPQFGTTDVFTIMPVAEIGQRYIEHFGATPSPPCAA
mgnify:CR=1 FL=1